MPAGFGLLGRLVFGVFGPRQPILGTELAGVVEGVGRDVARFSLGDEVFAFTGAKYGCHAEYRTMPEDGLIARKPANLTFDEAAALSFGGLTALSFLRDKGAVRPGDNVLIVGASGGVGTAAVQIAKHLGWRGCTKPLSPAAPSARSGPGSTSRTPARAASDWSRSS
jgi:NADPH:quinone reductase-like Zn-dependent oxidoreductase